MADIYQARSGITTRKTLSSLYNKTFDAIVEKYRKMDSGAAEFFEEAEGRKQKTWSKK